MIYIILSYLLVFVFAIGTILFLWICEEHSTRKKARFMLLIILAVICAPLTLPLVIVYGMWWLIIQALGKEEDV